MPIGHAYMYAETPRVKTTVRRSKGYVRLVAKEGKHYVTIASYSKKKKKYSGVTAYYPKLRREVRRRKR